MIDLLEELTYGNGYWDEQIIQKIELMKFVPIFKMGAHLRLKNRFFAIGVTIGKNVQLKVGRIPTFRI